MKLLQAGRLVSTQWTHFLLGCALALPMAALTTLPAQAQRPIRLSSLECYNVVGRMRIETEARNVVVSRQVYPAISNFSLHNNLHSEVTCLLPQNAQTLSLMLMFDDRDNRNSAWTLNFFVDGRPTERVSVESGTRRPVRVDLNGSRNLTIEAIHRSGSTTVYMTEAEIQLQPGSGRRP
jgi:hypothetical protein